MKRMRFGKKHNQKTKHRQSASRWHGMLAFFLCASLLLSLLMPSTSYGVFDSIPAKADSDDLIKVYQDDTLLGEYEDLAAAFAAMQQEDASYRIAFENAEGVYTIEGDVVLPKAKCIAFVGSHEDRGQNEAKAMPVIKISGDWKCQSDIEADDVNIKTDTIYGSYVFALGSYTLKVGENMKRDSDQVWDWVYQLEWCFQIVGEKGSCIEAGFEDGSWYAGAIVSDTLLLKNGITFSSGCSAMPTQVNKLIAESGTTYTIQLFSGRGDKNDCIRNVEIRENEAFDGEACIRISNAVWAKECLKLGNIYSYQEQNAAINLIYNISDSNRIHTPMMHTELLGYLGVSVDMKITLYHMDLAQWKYEKKHFLLKSRHIPVENIHFIEHNSVAGTDTDLETYVDETTGWIMLSKTALDTQEDDVYKEEVLSLNENNEDEKYHITYELDSETRTATVVDDTLKEGTGTDSGGWSIVSRKVIIPEYVQKDGIKYAVTTIASNALQSDGIWIDRLYISDNVKKISSQSFKNGHVSRIWIGKGVESIDSSDAFSGSMFEIAVDPENPYFMSEFGYLYTKNQDTLLKLTRGCEQEYRIRRFEVPDTVKKIAAYANDYPWFCNDFVYPVGTQIEKNALFNVGSEYGLAYRAGTAQELTEAFEQLVLESMDTLTPDFPIRQPSASASPSPTASTVPDVEPTPTGMPDITERPSQEPLSTPDTTEGPSQEPLSTPDTTQGPSQEPLSTPGITETPIPNHDKNSPHGTSPTISPEKTPSVSRKPNDRIIKIDDRKQNRCTEISVNKKNVPVIYWKKVKGTKGYEIWRSDNNKSYTKIKVIRNSKRNFYSDRKARRGQRYIYKIRCIYQKNGKIVYGSFSNRKVVSMKKLEQPDIAVSSGKTTQGIRYINIRFKKYQGKNMAIWYRKGNSKWRKLKLRTAKLPASKIVRIRCTDFIQTYYLVIQTYQTIKGKKQTSFYSKAKKVVVR